VILIDANILVYACVGSVPQHQAALGWLDHKLKWENSLVG
jgi:predicted nucleic acid-binding protein